MTEHPERVAAESTIPGKIVAAAASAAVAALVKKLLERGVERLLEPVRTETPMPAGGSARQTVIDRRLRFAARGQARRRRRVSSPHDAVTRDVVDGLGEL